MNKENRIVDPFSTTLTIPQEEKIKDFQSVLPAISNSKLYYFYMDGLNKAFNTNYVVNKCINILAYNLSKLPLRFTQGEEMLPIGTKIKGFDLTQPHPKLSLSRLLYECGVYYWYKGEFMSLIDTDAPFSLEPVDPDLMDIATSEGRLITSWRFDNSNTPIMSDELIYAYMMNPDLNTKNNSRISDKERVTSLIKVVKKEIFNYASGRDFSAQFFENFAQLGLTLTDTEGMTTKEDREAIVQQIDNKLSKGNAWRTRVLPQGLNVADTKNLSMREMEFSQSLKDIRDIILGVFGVPRSVFGITNESGLAQNTVDVEKRIMWTEVIQPAAYMIQEAFNQTLMRYYFPGYKVKFDYSNVDVLQEDLQDKADLAIKFQTMGFTMQEINEHLTLGIKDMSNDARMEERFFPSSLVPYSEVEMFAAASEEPKPPQPKEDEEKAQETQMTKSMSISSYKRKFNRAQRKIENKMVGKLSRYFAEQLGKVLSIVKNNKEIKTPNETIILTKILNLLDKEKAVLSVTMEPIYTEGSEAGSKLALDVLNSAKEATVKSKIIEELTNQIKGINNYTYKLVKNQVKASLEAGEGVNELSKRIGRVYKFGAARSRTIARTESLKVVSRSTDEEYRKEGIEKKRWIGGTRDSHVRCANENAIPYDQAFSNGLMFPGDAGPASEVVNCTCALGPVI